MSADDLAGERWVVGSNAEGAPELGARPGLDEPTVAFAVRGWPTRLGLVAAGLGITLLPGSTAEAVPRGVRWVPVLTGGAGLGRTAWAVTAADPRPAAAATVRALVEEVRSQGAAPTGAARSVTGVHPR